VTVYPKYTISVYKQNTIVYVVLECLKLPCNK